MGLMYCYREPITGRYALKLNTVAEAFMKSIRTAYLTAEQLADEEVMKKIELGEAISFQNERQAVHTAIKAVTRAYESSGSTIASDLKHLAKEGISFNERNIFNLRKSQKDVLRNAQRVIKQQWERQLLARELPGGLKF